MRRLFSRYDLTPMAMAAMALTCAAAGCNRDEGEAEANLTTTAVAAAAQPLTTPLAGLTPLCLDGSKPRGCYFDNDGDGIGGAFASWTCGLCSSGRVATAGDCDDTNRFVRGPHKCYVDYDGDGAGGTTIVRSICGSCPAGEAPINNDCDDQNAAVHASSPCYTDADGDGVSAGQGATSAACTCASGKVHQTGDCNDQDATVISYTCYADQDGDGIGAGWAPTNCTPCEQGYVNGTTGDCDDSDPELGQPHACFIDADGDGIGGALSTFVRCRCENGFADVGGDCDDNDASRAAPAVCYKDADSDGYAGTLAPNSACTCPAALSPNNSDCNDADPSVHWVSCYRDMDGDGRAGATTARVCAGFCDASSHLYGSTDDCDDTNAALRGWIDCKEDRDGDGYPQKYSTCVENEESCPFKDESFAHFDGMPSPALRPNRPDYMRDCDDDDASIHPEQAEVPYNNVDDNCDDNLVRDEAEYLFAEDGQHNTSNSFDVKIRINDSTTLQAKIDGALTAKFEIRALKDYENVLWRGPLSPVETSDETASFHITDLEPLTVYELRAHLYRQTTLLREASPLHYYTITRPSGDSRLENARADMVLMALYQRYRSDLGEIMDGQYFGATSSNVKEDAGKWCSEFYAWVTQPYLKGMFPEIMHGTAAISAWFQGLGGWHGRSYVTDMFAQPGDYLATDVHNKDKPNHSEMFLAYDWDNGKYYSVSGNYCGHRVCIWVDSPDRIQYAGEIRGIMLDTPEVDDTIFDLPDCIPKPGGGCL